MRKLTAAVATVAALLSSSAAIAQANYPAKPIRFIVALPPGSDTDVSARLLSVHFERRFKQSIVVENKPGGGGILAIQEMIKSPADGYTLLVNAHNTAYLPLILKSAAYTLGDIAGLGMIGGAGYVMVSSNGTPARTWGEFLAYAKANPGKITYADASPFPVAEISELFNTLGIKVTNVAYKGGAAAYQAVMTNEANMFNGGPFQAVPFARDGKLRTLAYTGAQRHPMLPDVPTVAESGNAGFNAGFFIALYGSAQLPRDLQTRLNTEVNDIWKSPDLAEKLTNMGYVPSGYDVQAMRRELEAVERRHRTAYERLGIKPQ